jgi:predicted CXXCH cytochrome family protein
MRGRAVAIGLALLPSLFVPMRSAGAPPPEPQPSFTAEVAPLKSTPVDRGAASQRSRYAGAETCGRCHAAELARWRGSDHDRAMEVATAEAVLGDFSGATLQDKSESWRFFRRDGRFWVEAQGPDGKRGEFEVVYTFGVRPLQQYLVELPGGRLQALTAAWDSRPREAGGQRWFTLSTEETKPGDPLHWTGDAFTWNRMCADCHSTGLERNFSVQADAYETRWVEIDVGCEACHGPGAAHVAWAEGRDAGAKDRGLAVDLAEEPAVWVMNEKTGIAELRGPPDRREVELCAPCHARRSPLAAADPGTPFLDAYRPSLLEEGLYHADGQMLDEVYVYGSFLQSEMYRAGVTCSDCHDPHGLELLAKGNALCARCHLPARFEVPSHTHHPAGSKGSECVACHMRAVTYMVLDDRHDHSLRVPRPDLTVDLRVPNACNDCHRERSPEWALEAVEKWYGPRRGRDHFGRALEAGRRHLPGANQRLASTLRDREVPGIARATAATLLGGAEEPAAREALAAALGDEDALVRMAAAEAAAGLPAADRPALLSPLLSDPTRSVRLAAAVSLADLPESELDASARAPLARALSEYRDAQAQSSDQPQAHVNLALLALAGRDLDGAERAYREAIRVGPYFVPAHVNLADLMRIRGDEARGEEALRAGLAAAPDNPDLHHSLGLLLVRRGKYAEATAELGRATELAPDRPHLAYVHAVALHSTGDGAAAVDALEKANLRTPNDLEILVALTTIERDRGNFGAAVVWARQLVALQPSDERFRALAAELEQRAGGSGKP